MTEHKDISYSVVIVATDGMKNGRHFRDVIQSFLNCFEILIVLSPLSAWCLKEDVKKQDLKSH